MDAIHAFLEEKDYHDEGLSWIVSAQTFPIKAVGLIVLISCLLGVNFFLQLSVDIHFADSSLLWIFLSPFHLLLKLSRNISFSAQLPEDCSKFYILEVM